MVCLDCGCSLCKYAENAIYWTKGGGFSSGNEIYRYEIGNPSSMDKPFYTIPEKGRVLYVVPVYV